MRRSDLAPGTVGFDHQFGEWEGFDAGYIFRGLEGASAVVVSDEWEERGGDVPIDANVESLFDAFERFFEGPRVRVNDTTERMWMGFERGDKVGMCGA